MTVDLTGQTLLGKLRVVRLLGQGGMGAVYEVEHLITRHHRALKVMHQHFSASTETVARFVREAGVAGTLKTPHVVETYDAGQLDDGAPYVLMELLNGGTFGALLESAQERAELLTPGRVVGIVCQVLEGLAVAHEAGVIHRDIKPDNIFVSVDERGKERVRILDFGISKFGEGIEGGAFDGTLTSEQTVMGTPYYMSPEQVRGAKLVDARSDLYSVGVMLFEGLSGIRPFDAMNMAALAIKIHGGDHVALATAAPHLSSGLVQVVERAMHRDASLRFESARGLLEALVPYAESNYTASLQTLRQVPQEGAIPMADPRTRKVDETANTLVATNTPPATQRRAARVPVWAWALAAGTAVAAAAGLAMFGGERATSPESGAVVTAPPPIEPPVVRAEPPPAPEVPVVAEAIETGDTAPEAIAEAPSAPPTPRAGRGTTRHPPSETEREADPPPRGRGSKILRDIYE